MQLHDCSHVKRWQDVCRSDFDLYPRDLATLVAICAFAGVAGEPMPQLELIRASESPDNQGDYELSLSAPARLYKAGLIRLIGPREKRAYEPTLRGLDRVRQ